MATGPEKVSFHSNSKKKGNAKECSNCCRTHSFHMLVRLCSKSFKLGFNSTWTEHFQMYKLEFEDVEEQEIKLPTSIGSWRKQRNSRRTSRSRSNSLNWTWNNLLVQNCKKNKTRLYCHPAYLTSMQCTSGKMPGWMSHKLESRFPGEISITSDTQVISL